MKSIRDKVLNETTNHCLNCNLREKCIEEECVIYRIEKIVEQRRKKDGNKIRYR
ncbi:MAG: hypothetical protein IJY25_03960 [Bacilli bacterium]|nr:hypothetical protein [Bacilli bacterium]